MSWDCPDETGKCDSYFYRPLVWLSVLRLDCPAETSRCFLTVSDNLLIVMCSQDDVKYVLDGTRMGNVGRYINHSCNVRSPMSSFIAFPKLSANITWIDLAGKVRKEGYQ